MKTERLLRFRLRAAPCVALIVEPEREARALMASTLAAVDFHVITANTFADAQKVIAAERPALLVADIRLGLYNGLELALRARAEQRDVVLVLTYRLADPIFQRETEALGGTFVPIPIPPEDFLLAVSRTALRRPNDDGTWTPIRPPFERRSGDRRGQHAIAVPVDHRSGDRRQALAWPLLINAIFNAYRGPR